MPSVNIVDLEDKKPSFIDEVTKEYFPDAKGEIAEFIFTMKYARYLPEHKRRETWDEAVNRVRDMHLRKFDYLPSDLKDEITWAFEQVRAKKALPSMRSMQFGGVAIEAKNERMYNCAVRHIDSIRSFAESFYLLLCGCGVGFGLSKHYLGRLPNLVSASSKTGTVMTYVVEDSIEGWADSVEALLNCYFENTAYSGRKIVFDYSKIRPAGTVLKTGGGKAPGYRGLKEAHNKIKKLLDTVIEDRAQNRLKSIDAYDILMHTADAVLSGGIRRSACSVIFDKDDIDMINAKTGNWFEENPQRARSNNSVLLLRSETTFEDFLEVFERTKEWGEPGFVFADDPRTLYNPCFEIGFIPVTDDGVCGVQFCNLTTGNGGEVKNEQDFFDAIRAETIIGTLQATYTDFKYLSNTAKELTEGEALLGVSLTAIMDSPNVLLDPWVQQKAATLAVETNKQWAKHLGINPAARVTAIKPEGTSTLALGAMASGIHPSHSRYMFRRVQVNKLDNVYALFKAYNPHMCEESAWSANGTDDVVTFPIVNPANGLVKSDLTAIKHLEIVKSTQENYITFGTNTEVNKKNVSHNVSCTIIVEDHEWDEVAEYLYANKDSFSAVSLIGATGDKKYAQAPMEAVVTEEDEQKFLDLANNLIYIDYTMLQENEDGTSLMQEWACAGGKCEV